jgi:hypothetical protein
MMVGAWLRFSHADWDATNHLHPDERGILFVAETIKLPARLPNFFTPEDSPLNPLRAPDGSERPFAYGHFPLYATAISQQVLALPCAGSPPICEVVPPDSFFGRLMNVSHQPRFTHLTYTGRALSALFDTLTILAVGLLAQELFNRWAGVIAASLACFAVLHIQNAHFGTVDTAAGLFATLTIWMLVRMVRRWRIKDGLLAGVFMGLAVGSKVNTGLLIVPLVAAHIQGNGLKRYSLSTRFWLSLLAGGISFALTNPYAVLDPVPFVTGITTQAALVSGGLDWVFARQYSGSVPLIYMIDQQARWLLGLPLSLAVYAGLVWGIIRAIRLRSHSIVITVLWASLMTISTSVQFVKFPRYMLPVMPTLFVLAGGMFSSWLTQPQGSKLHRKKFAALLLALTSTSAGVYAFAFVHMYEAPHPWVEASEWVYRTLPPGTTLIVERWDDPLPLDIIVDGMGYQRELTYDTRMVDPFSEPDNIEKLDEMLVHVTEADYIILSSNRVYGVIPRQEDRYPLSAAYYRALFSGELGFRLEQHFRRAPNLFGVSLYDDPFLRAGLDNPLDKNGKKGVVIGFADESFTVYDHPVPLIFANEERLSAGELKSRILAQAAE